MLGVGILAAGAVLLWAALTGKASNVLSALKTDVSHFNATVPDTNVNSGASENAVTHTSQFTVNLPGGGSVVSNASDANAAIENVKQQTGMIGTVNV